MSLLNKFYIEKYPIDSDYKNMYELLIQNSNSLYTIKYFESNIFNNIIEINDSVIIKSTTKISKREMVNIIQKYLLLSFNNLWLNVLNIEPALKNNKNIKYISRNEYEYKLNKKNNDVIRIVKYNDTYYIFYIYYKYFYSGPTVKLIGSISSNYYLQVDGTYNIDSIYMLF